MASDLNKAVMAGEQDAVRCIVRNVFGGNLQNAKKRSVINSDIFLILSDAAYVKDGNRFGKVIITFCSNFECSLSVQMMIY